MAKFVMIVPSSAKPGRDAEYNDWYDGVHLVDVCAVPGVVSGVRYEAHQSSPSKPEADYVALYEIEADDPTTVLAEINRRIGAGEMKLTDSLDTSSAKMMVFKMRS
jgi:hypothetical protein